MDSNSCFKLIYNFWTKFVKINCSSISKFNGYSGTNLLAQQSYLQPHRLQAFADKGRKMSSDQPDIKFEDADLYEKFMGVWSRMLGSKFIDWMSPDQGKSWVDIGCGNGAFTAQIIEKCAPCKVEGIDPSDAQVEGAKKLSWKVPVNFQTGDAMALPYDSDSFDIGVMALVLFFVPEPAVGLAEMKRVVKPGGTVAAYVWDVFEEGLPISEFHNELRSRDIEFALPPSSEASKYEVLKDLWEKADLSSIETKRIDVERTFNDFDEYWELNAGSMALKPLFDKLEPDIVESIKTSIQKKLTDQSTDGKIVIRGHVNAIKGNV